MPRRAREHAEGQDVCGSENEGGERREDEARVVRPECARQNPEAVSAREREQQVRTEAGAPAVEQVVGQHEKRQRTGDATDPEPRAERNRFDEHRHDEEHGQQPGKPRSDDDRQRDEDVERDERADDERRGQGPDDERGAARLRPHCRRPGRRSAGHVRYCSCGDTRACSLTRTSDARTVRVAFRRRRSRG